MCTVCTDGFSWGSRVHIKQVKTPCNTTFRGSDSPFVLPSQLVCIYYIQTHEHEHNLKFKKKSKRAYTGLGLEDDSFPNIKYLGSYLTRVRSTEKIFLRVTQILQLWKRRCVFYPCSESVFSGES